MAHLDVLWDFSLIETANIIDPFYDADDYADALLGRAITDEINKKFLKQLDEYTFAELVEFRQTIIETSS